VPTSFVVVLKNISTLQARGVDAAAQDLTTRYGGHLTFTYRSALRGFAVTGLTDAQARSMAGDGRIEYVQRDGVVALSATQPSPPSWGLDRIDQRALPLNNSYTYPSTADAVTAYIIDTGIRTSHSAFGGRASVGTDTIGDGRNGQDCNGHGTHVAGTVGGTTFGVAKGVRLVAVRVLDCQGSGTTAGVVAGVDWVTANHAARAVANMSLGGGADVTLDTAVANSINAGVTYGIAAGNGDIFGNPQDACTQSPARVPAAITVGATQRNDARASFSNFGTCLDIFAPGVDITSAWNTNDTATNTISGTSMATPHVVGVAALILAANPGFSPAQVRDTMVNNGTGSVVTDPRAGSPNRLLFVTNDGNPPPPPPPPPGCSGTNGTDVSIPDAGAAVTSPITVANCNRNASAQSKIDVHINHTWRGDLRIDLVAPDGTSYRLKTEDVGDGADNVDATYTANVSSEVANGTWRLRVQDMFAQDVGTLDTWTLTL
jgi:subtilisin family serine protease